MHQQSKATSSSSSNPITEGVIWQQLLLFFFPILFGTFFQQLYNTADAVIVGRFLGKQALAAVGGSTTSIINLLIGFFIGLSSGATVIISQYYGAKKADMVGYAVHTAITASIISGAILTAVGFFGAPLALRAMGTPEDVLVFATLYRFVPDLSPWLQLLPFQTASERINEIAAVQPCISYQQILLHQTRTCI